MRKANEWMRLYYFEGLNLTLTTQKIHQIESIHREFKNSITINFLNNAPIHIMNVKRPNRLIRDLTKVIGEIRLSYENLMN